MKITFEVDTSDFGNLATIFNFFISLADKDKAKKEKAEEPKEPKEPKKKVKADPKEEKAALDTVKEIIKEPAPKPKKSKAERQQDIQAIKDAVKEQKSGKAPNARKDIDDTLLIYMKDEQHMTLKQIAKELGCCEQTVLNRYNKAKRR